jgi:hypothetical protein
MKSPPKWRVLFCEFVSSATKAFEDFGDTFVEVFLYLATPETIYQISFFG